MCKAQVSLHGIRSDILIFHVRKSFTNILRLRVKNIIALILFPSDFGVIGNENFSFSSTASTQRVFFSSWQNITFMLIHTCVYAPAWNKQEMMEIICDVLMGKKGFLLSHLWQKKSTSEHVISSLPLDFVTQFNLNGGPGERLDEGKTALGEDLYGRQIWCEFF